jgi:diaminopimelate epimerase
MSGAGNLFSVINNSIYDLTEKQLSELAPILCSKNEYNPNRTEGLLSINRSKLDGTSFDVEFYNPDGSKDAMCGNGGRCAVAYAIRNGISKAMDNIKFSMADNVYTSIIMPETIKIYFPPPVSIKSGIQISSGDYSILGDLIDVGSKHFVSAIERIDEFSGKDIREIDISGFAKTIRHHSFFQPAGVNVNVYQILESDRIIIRTYERGVEAVTGACGTGAISVAISYVEDGRGSFPIILIPPSEEELIVDAERDINGKYLSITLEGGAKVLDEYIVKIPDNLFQGEA